MSEDFTFIESLVLIALPWFGSHPAVGRFVATPPRSQVVLALLTGLAALFLALRLAGWISLPRAILAWSLPYQAAVLVVLYRRFVAVHGREPIDAAFNFDTDITEDRVFSFSNLLLGLVPPAAVLCWSIWGQDAMPAA